MIKQRKLKKHKQNEFVLSGIKCRVRNGDKINALIDKGIFSKYKKEILTYYNGEFYTNNREKVKSINIENWKYLIE